MVFVDLVVMNDKVSICFVVGNVVWVLLFLVEFGFYILSSFC